MVKPTIFIHFSHQKWLPPTPVDLQIARLGMFLAPHSDGLTLALSAAAALVPEQLEVVPHEKPTNR